MNKKIKYTIVGLISLLFVGFLAFQYLQIVELQKQSNFHNAMWTVMLSASPKEVQDSFISEVNKKLK